MKSSLITVSICGLLLALPGLALAAPGIPNQFYGTAKYANGSNITSGNVIVNFAINPVANPFSVPIIAGKYGYTSDLFATDPGNNRAGQTLKFFIGAIDTGTTAVFANAGYTELNLSVPVPTDTVGNGANVSLSSVTTGEAGLPAGATNIVLTNTTTLDLSAGLIAGKVTLKSGVSGSPIVLTNSSVSTVSASIPDGTKITGPSGWNGKITPPVSGTPSGGNAPAGFSVGSTVITIGSSEGTLVFDKPVTILLADVTGAVGYRPSGSDTWVKITNVCASPYATPGNPPANGECAINNGTDTKIVTYHFTSFGSLTATTVAPAPSGGGGNSTATVTTLTAAQKLYDTNNDDKIDVLDFNALMVHWGEKGAIVIGDFDKNGVVDVFDFNALMVHWTA